MKNEMQDAREWNDDDLNRNVYWSRSRIVQLVFSCADAGTNVLGRTLETPGFETRFCGQ